MIDKKDFISILPKNICFLIFLYLSENIKSLMNLSMANKQYHQLIESENLWKIISQHHYPNQIRLESKKKKINYKHWFAKRKTIDIALLNQDYSIFKLKGHRVKKKKILFNL